MIDFQPNNHTLDVICRSNHTYEKAFGLQVRGFDDIYNYSLSFDLKDGDGCLGFVSQDFHINSKTYKRGLQYKLSEETEDNTSVKFNHSFYVLTTVRQKLLSFETIDESYDVIGIIVFNSTNSTQLRYLIDPIYIFVRIDSGIKYCQLDSVNTHFAYILPILNTFLCSALREN